MKRRPYPFIGKGPSAVKDLSTFDPNKVFAHQKGMERVNAEMFRFKNIGVFFALGKTFNTRQVTVGTTALRIIQNLRPMAYAIANDDATTSILIGNGTVALGNGWPISAEQRLVFAMAENTELFAIASAPVTAFILEMGI